MKILMVNKFLHPKGGSETYMLKLGQYLKGRGHQVEYFGMEHEGRLVGNSAGCYVEEMDFHSGSLKNLLSACKTIYSREARKKIAVVLDTFQPDIVHLNNINFQLTPSIYYEIRKHGVPMVQTVHDPQIGCPCHRLFIDHTQQVCTDCLDGKYRHCVANRCVSGSRLKSAVAALESWYYHRRNAYALVDRFICPSSFMAEILSRSGVDRAQLELLRNFPTMETAPGGPVQKKDYVLFFGRYSVEKGLRTLLEACRRLPDISFIFAGAGPLENELIGIPNLTNAGFQTGEALKNLIAAAAFSVYPSIWYENCPLSVLESQLLGTPVLGSDIGGIPELIEPGVTGELFKSGSPDELTDKITALFADRNRLKTMQVSCAQFGAAAGINTYYERLMDIYGNAKVKRVC
jgi:glycosyltransferase involved in cell wall biosynthesis